LHAHVTAWNRLEPGKKSGPNDQRFGRRPDIFQRFRPGISRRKIMTPDCTFSLQVGPDSFQNGPKYGFDRVPLDIPSAGSVQNILKKVKKRLVSPLEPR
jgi:hypothetical protein